MYQIISKHPINGEKIFTGSSLLITRLFVGLLDDWLKKVIVRVYWYDLETVTFLDCNNEKVLKVLLPKDIFDMENLESVTPCDF